MCASECMAGEKVVTEREQKTVLPCQTIQIKLFVLLRGQKETYLIDDET